MDESVDFPPPKEPLAKAECLATGLALVLFWLYALRALAWFFGWGTGALPHG